MGKWEGRATSTSSGSIGNRWLGLGSMEIFLSPPLISRARCKTLWAQFLSYSIPRERKTRGSCETLNFRRHLALSGFTTYFVLVVDMTGTHSGSRLRGEIRCIRRIMKVIGTRQLCCTISACFKTSQCGKTAIISKK